MLTFEFSCVYFTKNRSIGTLKGKVDHLTVNDDAVLLVIEVFQEGTTCSEGSKSKRICVLNNWPD